MSYVVNIKITKNKFNKKMPQLIPFYFLNQVVFTYALFVALTYVFSKYILPKFVRLFSTRKFISKL